MGVLLNARCDGCGYAREGLRLGATHAQIEAHDVSHFEVFAGPCCKDLLSAHLFLGVVWPEPPCDRCGKPVVLAQETRYRISTMKGEVLSGHPCPRCAARSLQFVRAGTFL